jgi:hypothetical protein
MHVLPKGFHRIRHYGLLASANRAANVAHARELLAIKSDFQTGTTTQEFKQEKLIANSGPLRRDEATVEDSAAHSKPMPASMEVWR